MILAPSQFRATVETPSVKEMKKGMEEMMKEQPAATAAD
jgi:hypothetical protein